MIAYAETGSPRQVARLRANQGENFCELTEAERKQLKRSQFAFSTVYPYTFDGLSYIATHHRDLSKSYGRKVITDAGEFFYEIKLPFADFIHYCLLDWTDSKKHLKDELRNYASGSKTNANKFFRYIPISKGNYVLTQPLIIFFHCKDQAEMTSLEVQRLRQIDRFNENSKIIQNIVIHVVKPFLNPILHKGVGHGWFSVPSALQAKIDTYLKLNSNIELTSLFLRKYYLYLNSLDNSYNKSSMFVSSIDLWEHVSPSEMNLVNGKYRCIKNWEKAKAKLKSAHKFFQGLKKFGVLSGSKLQPAIDNKFPDGLFAYQKTQQYKICYTRDDKFSISK